MKIVILLRTHFIVIVTVKHNDKYKKYHIGIRNIFILMSLLNSIEIILGCIVLLDKWVIMKTKMQTETRSGISLKLQ